MHHEDFLYAAAGSLLFIQFVLYLSPWLSNRFNITFGDAAMQLLGVGSANGILVLLHSWSIRFALAASLLSDVFIACRFLLELLKDWCMLANASGRRRR